ncbi:MAG: hypothetical protein IPP66_23505 [Anaerolineales bacterium]|nr:hypothetical protein [Anaerolineales bacterium]
MTNFANSRYALIGIEEKADDATLDHRSPCTRGKLVQRLPGTSRWRLSPPHAIVGIIVGIAVAATLNVDTGAIIMPVDRSRPKTGQ